jgi:hypothetical protein
MNILRHFILLLLIVFISCNDNSRNKTVPPIAKHVTNNTIQQHIDSFKKICLPGDLVVRLGDDFISDRIRYLSASDHSYSHAGIIVIHANDKMICNIYPDDIVPGTDTVRYDPIDAFLNRKTNLACALYRYDLSENEKQNFQEELNTYYKNKIRFDKKYDLSTDDKMYCSEMIYKALRKITADRIVIKQSLIPENMQNMLSIYFKEYNFTKTIISKRKIIAIDNLYNNPNCRLLMKFALKDIPKNE